MVGVKKLHDEQTEIFWDNYLYHGVIFDYIEKNGFGLIMPVRNERLADGVTGNYMHNYGMDTKELSKAEK